MRRRTTKAGTSEASAARRRALFVEAYLSNGGNATQAAIAAGYKPGAGAEKAGYRLSKDVRVSEAVQARARVGLERARLTADEVLASLARDIRFDPARLFWPDGRMKALHEMDEDTRLALRGTEISEIKVDGAVVGHTKKVRFPEKTAAREQGMKHFGLYEADNKQIGDALKQVSDAELAAELERYTALARDAAAGKGTRKPTTPGTGTKKPD